MSGSTHKIILFSEERFKCKGLVVFGKVGWLHEQLSAWNDVAKSLVVKRRWRIATNYRTAKPDLTLDIGADDGNVCSSFELGWVKSISALVPLP